MAIDNAYIWIRHSEKLYNNGKANGRGRQHDSGIKNSWLSEREISILCKKLVYKYKLPDKLIVSPFLRARQTANLFLESLQNEYNHIPKIEYSTDISEYLGFCKEEKLDLEPDTLEYFKEPYKKKESMYDLESRISKHIKYINNSKENIWIITHGLIMTKIRYFYKAIDASHFEPLEYLVLRKDILSSKQD